MIATFYIKHKDGTTEKSNICVYGSATFYKLIKKYTKEYKGGYVKTNDDKTVFRWEWK